MPVKPTTAARPQPAPDLPLSASVKYNPHLWGDAELRAIFVVRRMELETLVEAVRTAAPDSVPQHILITGHRGMGKSTLLRRVALAVRDDPDLSRDWIALNFPEEQYTVSNLTEFWRNVLDALSDTLERQGCPPPELARLDAAIANIENLPVAEREYAALALLTDCIKRRGQRILLLIDSTDQLFAGLAGGGSLGGDSKDVAIRAGGATPLWRLRKTLSHEKCLFWLGASYQALEAQHQYQDAFLDFFRLVELRSLSVGDMREAMLALARAFGMGHGLQGEAASAEMARVLDSRPERLKAMRTMTGGNPRTTVMLYDLFAAGGDGNVHNDLRGLLDMMTPLYKARMESLAEQPRKLLAHLMELWAPQSARSLAAAAGIAVTTVSGQLTRLETEGLVEKVRLPGAKRNGYQVAERFFNVWYLMRNASRRLRQRLTWLVEFMRLWFSTDELVDLAHVRACRLRDGWMCDETGLEYFRALAAALPEGHSERHRLEWSVFSAAQNTRRIIQELFDLDGEDREFATADDYLKRFRALDVGLARCPHALNKDEWIAAVKGSLSLNLTEKEKVAQESPGLSKIQYDHMMEAYSDEPRLWMTLHPKQAVDAVYQAVRDSRFFPDCPDSKLAYTQITAAFCNEPAAFRLALELFAQCHADSWLEKAYRKSLEFDEKSAYPWNGQGNLLQENMRRYENIDAAYCKAKVLNEKFAFMWYNLGNLLQDHLKHYDEAEAAYRKAIALDGKFAQPWNGLGNLLQDHLKRYDEAEAAYQKAIELDPDNPYPITNLAHLLAFTKQPELSTTHYRKVAATVTDSGKTEWDGVELALQSHLWLGNRDAARLALEHLVRLAAEGGQRAFFRLREQARECHQIGIGSALAGLMDESAYADFLKPFSLALRSVGADGEDALAEAPPEVALLAREMRAEILR